MPGKVGHDEQQIAEFLGYLFVCHGIAGLDQFGGFFDDLVDDMGCVGPVKTHARGAFLQFHRPCQRRQADGDPVQCAALRLARPFGGFDPFPVNGLLFGGFVARFVAKDMRVPRDHLVSDGLDDAVKGEMPGLCTHLGVIDRLQQQIAQFALQLGPVGPGDSIGHLVRLFDGIGRDGGEILFDIPWATRVRVTQAAHDFQQAGHAAVGVVDQGIISHCASFLVTIKWHRIAQTPGVPALPVINRIADFADDMTAWRRHLHAHPELQFDCHQTAAFVAAQLRAFGVDELHEGIATSGIVAIINGRTDGPTIGLRADMDALPMEEVTGLDHASTIPGRMHACGHDGHTTMLLGAARYLAETRNFAGRVALIFQPAEEFGGGAQVMVQEGVLDRFDIAQVYALHNAPGTPVGAFYTTPGPIMAAVDTFHINIKGRGGHGAMPHETADPIMAAVGIVQAIQTIVSRNHYAQDDLVVSVTQIHTGSADNVIPGTAYINGTVRTFKPEVQGMVMARLEQIVAGQAASFGVKAELEYEVGYPATVNDPDKAAFAADVAREVSADVTGDSGREMGAEDFAYLLEKRPGAYLFIGNGDSAGLHHPGYDFDDRVAPVGASFFARLVERALPVR